MADLPDISIQRIANDPRVMTGGRLIRASQFVASGPGGSTYTSGGVGTALYIPVDFGAGGYADSFSINVTTLGATSQYRLALYAQDATGKPGGLVKDLGALDVTGTGVKTSTATTTKVAGVMWMLLSPQGSNVAIISAAATGVAPSIQYTPYITQTTAAAGFFTANNIGFAESTSVTAAPPAVASPTALSSGAAPIVVWRWSAIAQA